MKDETLFPEITTKAERHEAQRRPDPEFIYQAMGAGVQSTTIALLAANGVIEKPKFAVFSDTGWEPQKVYDHLDKLEHEVLKPSGIELFRVRKSDLSKDAGSRFAPDLMPLYITDSESGKKGITKRQCTSIYKIGPLNRWVREQLGADATGKTCKYCSGSGERDAPWLVSAGEAETFGPCSVCAGTGIRHLVGSVPDQGAWARSYIGFSVDELGRVSASRDRYVVNHYPLLDLRMSRDDCYDYLADQGWGETPKSACIGCPFHTNAEWRRVKADPVQWKSAVEVDEKVRHSPGRRGIGYLHSSRVPLAIADISSGGDDELGSCSPYGCRSGDLNFDDQLSLLDEELQ
jgi:hypothetical protein